MKKLSRKKIMVCTQCGHEVSKCGEHSLCSLIAENKKDIYFCGNCGDNGSHQNAVESSKWIKARKIMGLPSKINY